MTTRAKVCRICMTGTTKGVISLFSVCNGSIRIYDKVMEVANVQISEEDGLPVWICYSCLVHLETSYQFKIQAEKSDQLFRNQLEASQKEADVVVIDDNTKSLQAISNTGVQCIMPSEQLPFSVGQKPSVDIEFENFIHENTTQNDENTNQEHFMSLSKGMGDDHSNDQNGIKITNVMSQAEQEVMNMPCTETCTCIEGQDGTITSKCEACTKMSSYNKSTDELTRTGRVEISCDEQTAALITSANGREHSSTSSGPVCTINVLFLRKISDKVKKNIIANETRVSSCGESISNNQKELIKRHHCVNCPQKFISDSKLTEHILAAHKETRGYKCHICERSYLLRYYLLLHMNKVHNDKVKKFKCEECGEIFARKFTLSRHERVKHATAPVMCEYCGKVFKNPTTLKCHRRIYHAEETSTFVCEVCGKSFITRSYLTCHMLIHNNLNLKCNICNKTYPHIRALKKHQSLVHTIKEKHKCTICNKMFKHARCLEVHMQTKHRGREKPKCHICNATFTQKASLTTHINRIHIGLTPYACPRCHEEFKWKLGYDNHVRKCIEGKTTTPVDSVVKKLQCAICNATFAKKSTLKTHMKVLHSGLKPYSCKHCKLEFKWKQSCDKHELKCLENKSDLEQKTCKENTHEG